MDSRQRMIDCGERPSVKYSEIFMDGELAALTKLELEHLYHGRGLIGKFPRNAGARYFVIKYRKSATYLARGSWCPSVRGARERVASHSFKRGRWEASVECGEAMSRVEERRTMQSEAWDIFHSTGSRGEDDAVACALRSERARQQQAEPRGSPSMVSGKRQTRTTDLNCL
ncbi:hypothetical protein FA13DRAFT_1710433 [Coprinellus micaceus]|uniref:Uncharacterized protein n=1 Tax=Coprinellus micaceus TaxID=71717 RepID=A0A4Y7TA38_COPMI|nr:hypothetical protein FA13DRAFT_1710433 [Coprinellus micaceus]